MDERFVVIRSRRAPGLEAKSPLTRGGPIAGPSATNSSLPGPITSLEVDVVGRKDAGRGNETDQEAKAPSMPFRLISPVAARTGAEPATRGPRPAKSPADAVPAWGVKAVGADETKLTGAGVTVAVIDTGIAPKNAKGEKHPAFRGVELIERDFTGEGNGDTNGHGTHCAGTIFGRDVDGVRIGVAPGVTRALIAKVIGKNTKSEHIADAIYWALDEGAHVISLSLRLDFPGHVAWLMAQGLDVKPATSKALDDYRLNIRLFDKLASLISGLATVRQPCLLIAATGNESARDADTPYDIGAGPPAVADGFIAVGALQPGENGLTVAPFSNTGPAVSAPGVGIVSAHPDGGLVALDGTSMATPHVAGVAALWAQKLMARPGAFRLKSFETALLSSATMNGVDPTMTIDDVGTGIVRAPV